MLPAFHPVPIGCGENGVKRPPRIPRGFLMNESHPCASRVVATAVMTHISRLLRIAGGQEKLHAPATVEKRGGLRHAAGKPERRNERLGRPVASGLRGIAAPCHRLPGHRRHRQAFAARSRGALPRLPPFSRKSARISGDVRTKKPIRENPEPEQGHNAREGWRGQRRGLVPVVASGRRRRSHQTTKRRRWRRTMANS